MKIIFENEHFIAVDKESGVLSVPPRIPDQRKVLGTELQNKLKIQIFPVHRLDFEVSGIILFAKNKKSHRDSQAWFENNLIGKHYEAKTLTQSFDHWPLNVKNKKQIHEQEIGNKFDWVSKILRGKKRTFQSDHGETALTEAKIIAKKENYLIWELRPITGKPHQLRFELSYQGFPILGDQLYGSKENYILNGIALNSYKLDFKDVQNSKEFGLPDRIEINQKF